MCVWRDISGAVHPVSRHALGGQLPDPHMRDSNERGCEGEVAEVEVAEVRRPPQTIPIPPPIPSHPSSITLATGALQSLT